jgi:RHS repeat-associated protein
VPQAYAASHAPHVPAALATTRPVHHTPVVAPAHKLTPLTSHSKPFATFPHVSSSAPFDGLGQLSFYTYVKHPITSTTCTCGKVEVLVNVATGNLLIHSVELQIRGTGLDFSLDAYYNSLATTSGSLGQNWVLSLGSDVSLSSASSGVTLHGPSGYSAFFATSGSGYTDAPGLNATLVKNSDGSSTLSFHRTGEQWRFDSTGRVTADTDKNGHSITVSYSSGSVETSFTDTQGRVITVTSSGGHITKIADSTGRSTSYAYNSSNQLTSESNLNGKVTKYGYDNAGNVASITDPLGNVTSMVYGSNHQIISITQPGGAEMLFNYPSGQNATVVTDQLGHNTTYNYNGNGQVISVVNALGNTVSNTTYTNNFEPATYQDALTNMTTYTYSQDGNNNLDSISDGNGVKTSLSYPTGTSQPYYPTGSTDPQGNTSSYSYDSYGNLLTSSNTSATPHVGLTYTYNTSGQLQGLIHTATDANGNVTTYGYDSKGNLTSVTPPSPLHATTYIYDSLSRVITQTDGNGNVTTYSYNTLNRIVSVSYKNSSGSVTSSVTNSYDDDGNVVKVADSRAGTTLFTYDSMNRQTQKTLPDNSTISYSYDSVGNLSSLTDAGGMVSYSYDSANELTNLVEPNGNSTNGFNFGYDVKGERISITYPSNSDTTATYLFYDKGGRITEIQTYGQTQDEQDYQYSYTNASGGYTSLRTSATSYLNGQKWTTSYSYDSLNRLTGATTKTVQGTAFNTTSTYSYDPNGNRTAGSTQASSGTSILTPYSKSVSVNGANEVTAVNGASCSSDNAGNQTSCNGATESYNEREQTSSMSRSSNTLSMGYTGTDSTQRTQTSGSRTASVTYNLLGLGTEKDSSGNLVSYTRDNKGNLLAERTSSGDYYFLFDGLGSVVGLLPPNVVGLASTYVYDPFGVLEQHTETQYNPWQFAGGYVDASTGFEKFGTRYYDPSLGRWTQQDPKLSANPYWYANDDPANLVDPSGFSAFDCTLFYFYLLGSTIATLVGGFAVGVAFILSGGLLGALALGGAIVTLIFAYGATYQEFYACFGNQPLPPPGS